MIQRGAPGRRIFMIQQHNNNCPIHPSIQPESYSLPLPVRVRIPYPILTYPYPSSTSARERADRRQPFCVLLCAFVSERGGGVGRTLPGCWTLVQIHPSTMTNTRPRRTVRARPRCGPRAERAARALAAEELRELSEAPDVAELARSPE